MAPGRVDRYLYVAIVSVLAIMPGMMTLLPPAIKHFMGSKDIGLKFGMVLTGEVSVQLYPPVKCWDFTCFFRIHGHHAIIHYSSCYILQKILNFEAQL